MGAQLDATTAANLQRLMMQQQMMQNRLDYQAALRERLLNKMIGARQSLMQQSPAMLRYQQSQKEGQDNVARVLSMKDSEVDANMLEPLHQVQAFLRARPNDPGTYWLAGRFITMSKAAPNQLKTVTTLGPDMKPYTTPELFSPHSATIHPAGGSLVTTPASIPGVEIPSGSSDEDLINELNAEATAAAPFDEDSSGGGIP